MAVTRIIEKNDATATLPEYEEFCDWLRHDGRHPDAPSSMHISWKSLAEARPTARPRLSKGPTIQATLCGVITSSSYYPLVYISI